MARKDVFNNPVEYYNKNQFFASIRSGSGIIQVLQEICFYNKS